MFIFKDTKKGLQHNLIFILIQTLDKKEEWMATSLI